MCAKNSGNTQKSHTQTNLLVNDFIDATMELLIVQQFRLQLGIVLGRIRIRIGARKIRNCFVQILFATLLQ